MRIAALNTKTWAQPPFASQWNLLNSAFRAISQPGQLLSPTPTNTSPKHKECDIEHHDNTLWHFLRRCDRACWNQSKKTVKLEMPHQTFFFGRFVFGCPVCPLCLVCLFLLGPSWLVGYFSSLNLVCVFLLDPSLHIVPTTFLEAHMYLHIFSYPFTSQHAIAWSLISWHGHAWHGDGSKDNVHDVMFLPCGCFCELCVDGSQHGKKKEIFHETS